MLVFLAQLIDWVFQALYLALMVRIFMSWIPHNPYHPMVSTLYNVTDPILKPFQNIMPNLNIGIDISPILAFFALGLLKNILMRVLWLLSPILS